MDYPLEFRDGTVSAIAKDEDDLPRALTEITEAHHAQLGRAGVSLHPRAFRRAWYPDRPRNLCPFSFPAPPWARMVIEQIVMDTSGMQVRLWHNDKPWLHQPNVYCEALLMVQEARTIVDDWLKDQRKKGHDPTDAHRPNSQGARPARPGTPEG